MHFYKFSIIACAPYLDPISQSSGHRLYKLWYRNANYSIKTKQVILHCDVKK